MRTGFAYLRNKLSTVLAWPLGTTMFLLAGWAALDAHLERLQYIAERDALADVSALARSYAKYVSQTVDTIDQTLLHTRFEWIQLEGKLQLENLHELQLLLPPSHFNVAIADRNGNVVTSAIPKLKPQSFANRSNFLTLKKSRKDILVIGPPEPDDFSPAMSNTSSIPSRPPTESPAKAATKAFLLSIQYATNTDRLSILRLSIAISVAPSFCGARLKISAVRAFLQSTLVLATKNGSTCYARRCCMAPGNGKSDHQMIAP